MKSTAQYASRRASRCTARMTAGILLIILFVACVPASQPPTVSPQPSQGPALPTTVVTAAPTEQPEPTPTRTSTSTPTRSATATSKPPAVDTAVPSPTITPMSSSWITPHPLALDAFGAAMNMKRLALIGQGKLFDIAWSPDGKYLAAATGSGVYLYETLAWTQAGFLEINKPVNQLAFSSDGTSIAVALGSQISIWDLASRQKTRDLEGEIRGGVWKLVYGRGGFIVAIGQIERGLGDAHPQVKIWQASSGQLLYKNDQIIGWTEAIDTHPDGNRIAVPGENVSTLPNILSELRIQNVEGFFNAAFSLDGMKLFTTGWDGSGTGDKFMVWMTDLSSGERSQILEKTRCQYLSTSAMSAICYGTDKVIQFDPFTGASIKAFDFASEPPIDDAAINSDGLLLAIMEGDRLKILNTVTGAELKTFVFDPFLRMAVGMMQLVGTTYYAAATGDEQGNIRIWNLADSSVLRSFQISKYKIRDIVFSPDGQTIASIDDKNILRLWRIQDAKLTHEFNLSGEMIDGPLLYSLDGLKIAATNVYQDRTFEFNLQTGELKNFGGSPSSYTYAYTLNSGWYTYSDDGHLITWKQEGTEIVLKDNVSGEKTSLPLGSESSGAYPEAVALSHDGQYFAAGRDDTHIIVWDLREQKIIQILQGHKMRSADGWMGAIKQLIFSPQTDLLASVGWDNTTRLWNIHTGVQLQDLDVCCFAGFSPDGRVFVTARQGVIRVWGIRPWP